MGSEASPREAERSSESHTLPHRHSLAAPDRSTDADDAEIDVTAPKTRGARYMNQSFISLIANAGSKGNFNSQFKLDSSDDDADVAFAIPSRNYRKLRAFGASSSHHPLLRDVKEEMTLQSMPRISDHTTPSRPVSYTSEFDPLTESQILIPPTKLDPQSHLDRGDQSPDFRTSLPTDTKDGSFDHDTIVGADEEDDARALEHQESNRNLSTRVAQIFGLEEEEEILSEYPCWLLQSVLLRGYMYVTQKHICFYSYLPKRSNAIAKSGFISKRGRQNPTFHRYWFILKGDVLSYYSDPSELYFPRGTIDLRSAISAEISGNGDSSRFAIQAHQMTHHFKAESGASAKEWVKQIHKVLFRSHNDGDSVKILLPIDNILDIEENPVIDFSDTFKIRIIDNDETYVIDEYFFSFFGFGQDALRVLQTAVNERQQARKSSKTLPFTHAVTGGQQNSGETALGSIQPSSAESLREKTPSPALESVKEAVEAPMTKESSFEKPQRDVKRERKLGIDRRSREQSSHQGELGPDLVEAQSITASQILQRSDMFKNPTVGHSTPQPHHGAQRLLSDAVHSDADAATSTNAGARLNSVGVSRASQIHDEEERAIRPSSSFQRLQDLVRAGSYPLQKASGLAEMLRNQSARMGSLLASGSLGYYEKVSSMWAGKRTHYDEAEGPHADDVLDENEDHESTGKYGDRFRQHFALPDDEKLQATFYCYVHRVVPIYGKMDVENVVQEKGFRFGYSGLVIIVRGHEELFFEFRQPDARDDCGNTILQILESSRHLLESRVLVQDDDAAEAERIAFEHARDISKRTVDTQAVSVDQGTDATSPVIFDDTAASILNFKPAERLKITCLTVGSRGDVQPYIALCKGLKKEGHYPTIATHVEFEPWIREHGINFAPVAGDPGEIMRLCVENDMFTVSFFREANSKFRGWIDQLFNTAWRACQGAQLLIESPSAMAGIHIAEALQIPYFRAFTMPWTRTRAYPHAFVVPNQKMGGNYNSLSYVLFDNVFWQATSGQINRWRGKTLGLPSTNLEKLQAHKTPFLYNFSPSVVVPPLDFNYWIRITGYWFLDEGKNYTPPKELAEFIRKARADRKKLVYVGFGSIVVPDSAAMTRTVVNSVIQADVRCILSKGWSERLDRKDVYGPEIPLPRSIYEIASAPHDWLFRQMDAAAHHGGAGTTGASLRAGIPTIIKPFFGDQFFFGSRVEDLGVGMCLKTLNTKVFARALRVMTSDERVITKAKALGEQIRSEDGVNTAIQAIYRDLDYAKSLVKRQAPGTAEAEESEESWTMIDEAVEDPQFQSTLLQRGGLSGAAPGGDDRDASTRSSDYDE